MYWAEAVWCVVYPACASSKLCEDKGFKKYNNYFTIAQTWTDEVSLALTCLDCLERSSFLIANVKMRKLRIGNLSSVARKQSPVVSCLYSFVDSFLKWCNWVVSTFLFLHAPKLFLSYCCLVWFGTKFYPWEQINENYTLNVQWEKWKQSFYPILHVWQKKTYDSGHRQKFWDKQNYVSGHWHHKSHRMAEEKCILCDMRVSLSGEAQIIFLTLTFMSTLSHWHMSILAHWHMITA